MEKTGRVTSFACYCNVLVVYSYIACLPIVEFIRFSRRESSGDPSLFPPLSLPPAPMSFDLARSQVVARDQSRIRENARRGELIRMVGPRLRLQPPAPSQVDLDYCSVYLQCSRMTLGFALLPRAIRRPQAIASRCASKRSSWRWLAQQARECLPDRHGSMQNLLAKSA